MMLSLLLASVVVALCGTVRRHLDRAERTPQSFCQGRIHLTALWNHKAAFGLPIPQRALVAGSAVGMLGLLLHPRASRLGIGLILGGGLSNLAERLARGRVYDYLQFPKAPGKLKRYVYNLADFAVFFGLLALFLHHKRPHK